MVWMSLGGEQARINCLQQVGGGVVSARCGAAGLREPSPTTTWCEREDELDGDPLVGVIVVVAGWPAAPRVSPVKKAHGP